MFIIIQNNVFEQFLMMTSVQQIKKNQFQITMHIAYVKRLNRYPFTYAWNTDYNEKQITSP